MASQEMVLDYWDVLFGPEAINNLTLMLGASGFEQTHRSVYVDLCFEFQGNNILICIERSHASPSIFEYTYAEVFNNMMFLYSISTHTHLRSMPLHKINLVQFERHLGYNLLHDLG